MAALPPPFRWRPKRTALLTSVVRHLEEPAVGDVLDVFALLMQ
ncbi:hypothetical protein [Streptomyces sp. NPDC048623]